MRTTFAIVYNDSRRLFQSVRQHSTYFIWCPRLNKTLELIKLAIDSKVGTFVFVFCTNQVAVKMLVFVRFAVPTWHNLNNIALFC